MATVHIVLISEQSHRLFAAGSRHHRDLADVAADRRLYLNLAMVLFNGWRSDALRNLGGPSITQVSSYDDDLVLSDGWRSDDALLNLGGPPRTPGRRSDDAPLDFGGGDDLVLRGSDTEPVHQDPRPAHRRSSSDGALIYGHFIPEKDLDDELRRTKPPLELLIPKRKRIDKDIFAYAAVDKEKAKLHIPMQTFQRFKEEMVRQLKTVVPLPNVYIVLTTQLNASPDQALNALEACGLDRESLVNKLFEGNDTLQMLFQNLCNTRITNRVRLQTRKKI